MRLTSHDPRESPRPRGRSERRALDAMLADIDALPVVEPDGRAEADATLNELATAAAATKARRLSPHEIAVEEVASAFHDLPGGRDRVSRELPRALFTSLKRFHQQEKDRA